MIGGVANIGNSCYVSQVLQQLAAEPDFFNTSIESLRACIDSIRNGRTVGKFEVRRLMADLEKEGWEEKNGNTGDSLHLLTFISTISKIHQYLCVDDEISGENPVIYVNGDKPITKIPNKALWIVDAKRGDEFKKLVGKTHDLALRSIHMTRTFFCCKHSWVLRKLEGKWYKCDDENVSLIPFGKIPSSQIRRFVYFSSKIN